MCLYLNMCTCVWVPTEDRKEHQIPWRWSYRVLWIIKCGCWDLSIRSLGRTSALNCLPISLVPYLIFLFKFKKSTEFRELEWQVAACWWKGEVIEVFWLWAWGTCANVFKQDTVTMFYHRYVGWNAEFFLFYFYFDFIISLKSISASPMWSTIFQLWILDSHDLKLQAYDYEMVVLATTSQLTAQQPTFRILLEGTRDLPPHIQPTSWENISGDKWGTQKLCSRAGGSHHHSIPHEQVWNIIAGRYWSLLIRLQEKFYNYWACKGKC